VIIKYLLCSVLLFTLIGQVNATEQAESNKPAAAWGGEAEIGILMTRGNTHTDSQNSKLGVHYHTGSWEHKFRLESLRTEDSGVVSANRFVANYRSTYKFSAVDYGFGALRHEKDCFAGFDRRDTEVLGYGRKLYNAIKS
jgi:putative salt-induced outer membrane protein